MGSAVNVLVGIIGIVLAAYLLISGL